MRNARIILQGLAVFLVAMLVMPVLSPAQDQAEPEQTEDRFSKEELTQMLAPIALYPDSLIAQILMASTYPLEVVEAERWIRENKGLKGDALGKALQEKTWDPSVKSLCQFPEVLIAMSDKLDQTRKLGDAYLAQQDDVMDTVQELRRRAEQQGNLKTTKEHKVVIEREIVRIEPASPEVVYVPVYDPLYVYGPWWYPAYRPWYWYWPPHVVITGGFITFGPHFFIGFDLFSWCWFDWHSHHIFVDFHRAKHFHRHHFDKHDSGRHFWKHNPVHRRGVAYRDRRTSERFLQGAPRRSLSGPEVRGFPSRGDGQRDSERSRGRIERRESGTERGTRTGPDGARERIERQDGSGPRRDVGERERIRDRGERREGAGTPEVRTERERGRDTIRKDTPFRGIGEGNFERRAGERGGESRRSGEIRQQGGDSRSSGGIMRPDSGRGRISGQGGGQRSGSGGGQRGGGGGGQGSGRGGGFRR